VLCACASSHKEAEAGVRGSRLLLRSPLVGALACASRMPYPALLVWRMAPSPFNPPLHWAAQFHTKLTTLTPLRLLPDLPCRRCPAGAAGSGAQPRRGGGGCTPLQPISAGAAGLDGRRSRSWAGHRGRGGCRCAPIPSWGGLRLRLRLGSGLGLK